MRRNKIDYSQTQEPISVIIYSKFGYEDIESIIPALCNQDYRQYEVIFVLNEEHKLPILVEQKLKTTYSNLYFTYFPADTQVQSRYKLALSIGLKAAKHSAILLTQSHCVPASNKWITTMARNRVPGIDLVVGITQYNDSPQSQKTLDAWIGNLLRIRCYSTVTSNIPFMGFGSNLLFSKSLYLQDQHIKSHLRLLHGEDDLFVNQCSSSKNTRMELDQDSMVIADVRNKNWIIHRLPGIYLDTRHYYHGKNKKIFAIENLLHFLFILSIIFCGLTNTQIFEIIGLITISLLSLVFELMIVRKNAQITHQTNYVIRGLLYRMIAPILFRVQGKYKHKTTRYE